MWHARWEKQDGVQEERAHLVRAEEIILQPKLGVHEYTWRDHYHQEVAPSVSDQPIVSTGKCVLSTSHTLAGFDPHKRVNCGDMVHRDPSE